MDNNNNEFQSVKDKISDIGFRTGSFIPDGQTTPINYTSLVLRVIVDGTIEELPLSGASAIKPKLLNTMLKSIKPSDNKSFLENEN
jgi:hypothetical protein